MAEPYRILIVDDSGTDRELFRTILERNGYSVFEASSGKETLKAIQGTRFDMMILDLSMPDMDGFEVLRMVRSKLPHLRIIVASGFMDGNMLRVAKALGATATLDKTLAVDLLLPMVGKLLKE
jgi:CheY-like chemotaxis protein